jgi:hypothetical protein
VNVEADVAAVWAERAQHVRNEHAGPTSDVQHGVIGRDRRTTGEIRDDLTLGTLVAGDRADVLAQPEWRQVGSPGDAIEQALDWLGQPEREAACAQERAVRQWIHERSPRLLVAGVDWILRRDLDRTLAIWRILVTSGACPPARASIAAESLA